MKKIIYLLITIVFVNSIIYFYYGIEKNNIQTIELGKNLGEYVDEIIEGTIIDQQVYIDSDEIKGLNIMFSTFNRINQGKTVIQIKQRDEVLYESVLENSNIQDNAVRYIEFDMPIRVDKGEINICIIGQSDENNGVTVWIDKDKQEGQLTINSIPTEGALVLEVVTSKHLSILRVVSINIVFICINVMLYSLMRFLRKEQQV